VSVGGRKELFWISLKPDYIAWEIANEPQRLTGDATQTDLRLMGIRLGSFLDFASIYYSWHRKNNGVTKLNRHAVIHCVSASS